MADATGVNSTLPIRIGGVSTTSGLPDNYADVTTLGQLLVKDASDGSVTPGTAAGSASLAAGQYNSTLPILTSTQQSAVQLDASGRIIISTTPQSVSGTISSNGQSVIGFAAGTILIEVTGTWVGTLDVFGDIDGVGYGLFISAINGASPLPYTYAQITSNGVYKVVSPAANVAITVEAVSWTSGTANIVINSSQAASIVEAVQFNQANMLVTAYQGGTWSITATNPSVTFTGNEPPAEATYIGGSVTTSAPTYTTGQLQGLSLTTAGALRVDGSGVTQPVSQVGGPWTQNITEIGGSAIALGQTTMSASFPVTIANNQSALAVSQSGAWTDAVTQSTSPWIVKDASDGSVSPGTAASFSMLIGGQYNSTLSTLTTGQQAAMQLDSSGRLIIAPLTNTSVVKSQLQDNAGNAISSYNSQLEVADILDVGSQYRAQSVTTTAAEALGATTILANRKLLHITPTNGTIYWGYSNAVTTTTGTPLFPNNTLWLSVGASTHVYVIAAVTTDSRIGELS
jgi:hypothetical protein